MSDGAKQDPPSLDEFAKRLDDARGRQETDGGSGRTRGVALGRAFRVGSELLAGLLVGALLGAGADALFDTKPWLLLVGILMGFAAGVLNVARAFRELGRSAERDADASGRKPSGQG
ncbi:MAG: AtpZ/AtpI family protein [Parvularculaceae bacterium]|nr:AtpZ/AtpI family protein [Parvularculaceae bacterium]